MKKAISFIFCLLFIPCFFTANALDCTKKGWGQGHNVNDMNQPTGCIDYNQKYGQYDAVFLTNKQAEIVLTFDEGYENGFTANILDTLKSKNVKAIFFITYDYAKGNPDLVKRMINEGHTVGNHTTSHPSMATLSQSEVQNEVMTLHNYIKSNFGYEMNTLRPPMGEFSEQSLYFTKSLGYKTIFWSFAYKDYDINCQPDCDKALTRVTEALHPGAIYLLHAVSKTNTAILPQFIDVAHSKGYKFTTEL